MTTTPKPESDTPLCDAEASEGWSGDAICVSADFARSLERQLTQSKADYKELKGIAEQLALAVKERVVCSGSMMFEHIRLHQKAVQDYRQFVERTKK